jgi:hypothetical protein
VPDPRYATGDQRADGTVAIPRCFACTLADWEHAEDRAERQAAGTTGSDVTANGATGFDGWTSQQQNAFLTVCAEDGFGTCECLADQLAPRVPGYEVGDLAKNDPRIQAAVQICQPSEGAVGSATSPTG